VGNVTWKGLRRNTLAAVLMSLSPLVVGVQDLVSSPDFPL
jgi:hypothetical protein